MKDEHNMAEMKNLAMGVIVAAINDYYGTIEGKKRKRKVSYRDRNSAFNFLYGAGEWVKIRTTWCDIAGLDLDYLRRLLDTRNAQIKQEEGVK